VDLTATGFVVLERFRVNANIAVIPVIVVSGRDGSANKERALKAGAKAFVQKPWNDKELLAVIAELLSGQSDGTMSGEYRLID
jgi:DNA-binding response OmpR family regulator